MFKYSVALLFCSVTALRAALVFDPAADFSATENSNGVWTYGYTTTLGGSLLPFNGSGTLNSSKPLGVGVEGHYVDNFFSAPLIVHNPTTKGFANTDPDVSSVEPGGIALHPGENREYAALRFTAPDDGSYSIAGSFFGDNTAPTSTDAHVLVNGDSIFDGIIQGVGPASSKTFSVTRQLRRGDTVDFAVGVGPNNNFGSDLTGLNLTITQLTGVYDAKSDFSATENPSGAWTFGYSDSLDSTFVPFTSLVKRNALDYWVDPGIGSDPGVGHNPDKAPQPLNEIYFKPHELVLHPGFAGQYAIARWTAPSSGKYLMQSTFVGEGGVSTTDVHIRQNGAALFDGSINGRGKSASYSSILPIESGDVVDFAVGFGADHAYNSDTTGLDVQFRPVTQVESTNLTAFAAIELTWPLQAGGVYQLQSAATINAAVWQNVGEPFRDPLAPTNRFLRIPDPKRFYRLITYK